MKFILKTEDLRNSSELVVSEFDFINEIEDAISDVLSGSSAVRIVGISMEAERPNEPLPSLQVMRRAQHLMDRIPDYC